jgi:methyl-accepting chemotaxis protein
MIDIIFASKSFERIKKAFDEMAGSGSGSLPKILDQMLGAFQGVVTWIDKFITAVEASSFSEVFSTRMTELADDLQVYASDFLKGLFNISDESLRPQEEDGRYLGEGKTLSQAILSKITEAISPYIDKLGTVLVDGATAALKSMGQKMLDELVSFWNNNQLITAVAAGIVGLFAAKKIAGIFSSGSSAAAGGAAVSNAGASLRGIAAGVSAFANPLALIGLTALVAAVNGLALAARIASPAFEPLGKMIKSTLDGLAPLVTSVFSGINTFVATIGGTIVGVINGVTNGIAKLTDKTATINATTDQLERLSKIPSENLIGAATGIEKMKAALSGFTPGFFSGLSQAMGSFFAGDQAEHITRLAEAGSKLNTATANLNIGKSFALPEGLEGRYKLFAEQMYNLAPSVSAIAFTLDKVKMDPLQKLADLGPALGNAAVGYAKFNDVAKQFDMSKINITKEQIDRLSVGTTKIQELTTMVNASTTAFKKLDDTGLTKIKAGIEALNSSFKEFNTSFVDNLMPLFTAIREETPAQLLTDANDKLNQLNTNIVTLISVQGEARNDLGKIAGNTNRGITGRSVY